MNRQDKVKQLQVLLEELEVIKAMRNDVFNRFMAAEDKQAEWPYLFSEWKAIDNLQIVCARMEASADE